VRKRIQRMSGVSKKVYMYRLWGVLGVAVCSVWVFVIEEYAGLDGVPRPV